MASIETELIAQDTIVEVIPEPVYVWGLNKDSIAIDSFKVKRNQSLSDILRDKNISARTVHNLALNAKDIFDVRKIKSGNAYYLNSKRYHARTRLHGLRGITGELYCFRFKSS